ncbi:MAG: hypothetical protein J1E84_02845 [Muribaculaceae bacterium]|nr:hypothetical protein [Muribaculaceae bacterium]
MELKELIKENERRRAAIEAQRRREIAPVRRRKEDSRRFSQDFEFWAERCVKIRHKLTGKMVSFRLNRAQKNLLEVMEEMRLKGEPIRVILLKSRQWGGSTLIQIYMAWIQMIHRENWHSLVCAHVKDTAATIRGMYSRMLEDYPKVYVGSGKAAPQFKCYERSHNTRVLSGRNCRVTISSAESQDSVRGNDFSMAHLSEVAFWRSGTARTPMDMMRAVTSGIPMEPYTLIAIESTANGAGNYFHSEWLRAEGGRSAYRAVFVPWYMAEFNELAVNDAGELWDSLDEYERRLWREHEITLEQLNWYHHKRMESPSHEVMKAEYPTTPQEAFVNTGNNVFGINDIDRLRLGVVPPLLRGNIEGDCITGRGSMENVRFKEAPSCSSGETHVWQLPEPGRHYVAAVDVGGRWEGSDYSVIAVFSRREDDRQPELVAQWRGHLDHDLMAWKAAAMATFYNRALLIVESNTLESEVGLTEENDGAYLLQQLNHSYLHLYRRRVEDAVVSRPVMRVGFHTNRRTKQMIINHLISIVRDGEYIEHDEEALNELSTYERKRTGAYGARSGCHDDLLMTRAIALFVMDTEPSPGDGELLEGLKRRRC